MTVRIEAAELKDFAASVLAAVGMEPNEAALVAEYLIEANLRGVDGHGVMRLTQYVESIRAGGINLDPNAHVVRQDGATAMIDADGGYGFRPAQDAMDLAMTLAQASGIGCVGVFNSRHFGVAVTYALRAAERGYVGLALSNTSAVMPAPGGLRSVVGNAPTAVAVPRETEPPLAVDLAMSTTSWGKISLAAGRGESIPAGWARAADGADTTDPRQALEANLLVSVGDHKGFALAVLLELVAGGLSGAPVALSANAHAGPGCGHLLIAIDPDRFGGAGVFAARVEEMARAIVEAPSLDGVRPRVPGSGGFAERARRLADGIPVEDDVLAALRSLAEELGVQAVA